MTDIAIRVENLSKQYRIGKRERYRTLRDTLTDAAAAPFRRLRNPKSAIHKAQALGYRPEVHWREGLRRTVGWYGKG